jgi:hypothetical protein
MLFDNWASRLLMPSSPNFEHRQEVVAHTGTEREYPAPITTERSGVGTEEQDSVRLFTPESNPSLNLCDFDIEVSQKL